MGFANEFMQAFTKAWWALPRTETEIEVDAASVKGFTATEDGVRVRVPERLYAMIEDSNTGSKRVLEKSGFKQYNKWVEPDSRAGFEGQEATLAVYTLERPES